MTKGLVLPALLQVHLLGDHGQEKPDELGGKGKHQHGGDETRQDLGVLGDVKGAYLREPLRRRERGVDVLHAPVAGAEQKSKMFIRKKIFRQMFIKR